jgi:hypothetical protein
MMMMTMEERVDSGTRVEHDGCDIVKYLQPNGLN